MKSFRKRVLAKVKKEKEQGKVGEWSKYLEMTDGPFRKAAEVTGKEALKKLVKLIIKMINAEIEYGKKNNYKFPKQFFKKDHRGAMIAFYIFKWLNQMTDFYPAADPGNPVPMACLYLRTDKRVGCVHNLGNDGVFKANLNLLKLLKPMMDTIMEYLSQDEVKDEVFKRLGYTFEEEK